LISDANVAFVVMTAKTLPWQARVPVHAWSLRKLAAYLAATISGWCGSHEQLQSWRVEDSRIQCTDQDA
jgi:hypothetical protein